MPGKVAVPGIYVLAGTNGAGKSSVAGAEFRARGVDYFDPDETARRILAANPGFTKEDYAEVFRKYLGVTNVLWLGSGIAGDDTHGHVDDLTRFVNESTVVTIVEEDRTDANYAALQENVARLKSMKDQDGKALNVETLPMPAKVEFEGFRLPASYANFYIANKIAIVPTFTDVNDRVALNTLAKLFSGREVVGVPCRDLVLGLGTLHCMTQQEPVTGRS